MLESIHGTSKMSLDRVELGEYLDPRCVGFV